MGLESSDVAQQFIGKLGKLLLATVCFYAEQAEGLKMVHAADSSLVMKLRERLGYGSYSHLHQNRSGWAWDLPFIGHINSSEDMLDSSDYWGIPAMPLPSANGMPPVELPPVQLPLAKSSIQQIPWGHVYGSLALVAVIVVISLCLQTPSGQRAVQSALRENSAFEMLLVSSLGTGMYVAYFVPIALQLPLMEWLSLSYTQYGYLETVYSLLAVTALLVIPGWLYDVHPFRYNLGAGVVATCGSLICLAGILSKAQYPVLIGFAILGAAAETFLVCQDTLIANYFSSSMACSLGFQYAALDLASAFTMCLAFMGMSIVDGFLVGSVACSCSLLASVILSAILTRPGRKEAEVIDDEAQSPELVADPKWLSSRNVLFVSVMIAFAAISQYGALSASRTTLTAANSWALGTVEGETYYDWVSVITFVVRSILGILLGFAVDKVGIRSKMVSIIVVAFVDAAAFALFSYKLGHPLPLWIVLQTSENLIQSSTYALLAVLQPGKLGFVYSVLTACMEGASCIASLLQGIIVDANNGSFEAAFLVHAATLIISGCAGMAALQMTDRWRSQSKSMKQKTMA